MREPHVKHLEGPLWEMRLKGKDGISRGDLRYRERPPCGCGQGVCEEDPEDAAAGNRPGVETSKGGEQMSRIRVDELHKNWMKDLKYRREYQAWRRSSPLSPP